MDERELEFEDIFKSLLDFTENFIIRYDYTMRNYDDEDYATYRVCTVNGESIYSFQRKISELSNEGFTILAKQIQTVEWEYRINFLKQMKAEMQELKHKVIEDVLVFEESIYGAREEVKFHSFINYTLEPQSAERKNAHKKSVLKEADDFAVSLEDIIDENSRKIEFLINQQELMPEPKSAIKDKNTVTIFYSWQSDDNMERKFIWKALEKLTKDLANKGKNVVIESDMRGTSGSQDIPNTLFQKIRDADIFIADVNLIGLSIFRDDAIPNPNVMIELGFAAATLGWDRVLLAMNTKDHKIEHLPFDIRQRSILWYNSDQIESLEKKILVFVEAMIKK